MQERDRQTDRRTDNGRQQRSRLHRAVRGKNTTFVNASCEKPQFIVDGQEGALAGTPVADVLVTQFYTELDVLEALIKRKPPPRQLIHS